jgi:maltose O-acetyltransferase
MAAFPRIQPPSAPSSPARDPSSPLREAEPLSQRWSRVVKDEVRELRPRLVAMNALLATLPDYTFCRVRTSVIKAAGFDIGRGSTFFGAPRISGDGEIYGRLKIGHDTAINVGLVLDLGAEITIGNQVSIGHDVMILTTSHKMGPASHRSGAHDLRPVSIGDGSWICSRATILAGVKVGAGSVVSAGAVVNKDVPPNSVVAGSPAKVIVPKLR